MPMFANLVALKILSSSFQNTSVLVFSRMSSSDFILFATPSVYFALTPEAIIQ